MKPKEFKRGSVIVRYTGKTWSDSQLSDKCFILYGIILFEMICSLGVIKYVLHSSRDVLLTGILLFAFSLIIILLSLTIGYSIIYDNKESKIQFLNWIQNIEDIRVQVVNGKLLLYVKQGRTYNVYSMDSFLKTFTTKYKIINKAKNKLRYIVLEVDFNNPEITKVILN